MCKKSSLKGSRRVLHDHPDRHRSPVRHPRPRAALVIPQWKLVAELADTSRGQHRPRRPCLYCGEMTKAVSQVCLAHSDLTRFDPHTNVQAGRFTPKLPRDGT